MDTKEGTPLYIVIDIRLCCLEYWLGIVAFLLLKMVQCSVVTDAKHIPNILHCHCWDVIK